MKSINKIMMGFIVLFTLLSIVNATSLEYPKRYFNLDNNLIDYGLVGSDINESNPVYVTGQYSQAIETNSTHNYQINITDNNLGNNVDFSVSYWIYVVSLGYYGTIQTSIFQGYPATDELGALKYDYIIWDDNEGFGEDRFVSYITENMNVVFYTSDNNNDGGDRGEVYTTSLNSSQWYHIVLVHDGSSTPTDTLYLNGVQVDSDSYTETGNDGHAGFWYVKPFNESSEYYIDELWIFDELLTQSNVTTLYNGYKINNTLPYLIFANAIQEQVEINDTVQWSVSIGDNEDSSSTIYSAFDCENDDSLEYSWSQRGIGIIFNCTYDTEGNYTAKVWMSDPIHFPTSNSSDTDETVEVLTEIPGGESPTIGGDCIGFSDPDSCTGTCVFKDTFTYSSHPVSCKNWEGNANEINPTSNQFSIFNVPITYYNIYVDETIYQANYYEFEIEFDFILNSSQIWQFDVLNNDLDQYLTIVTFEDYVVKAYDLVAPQTNTIGNVTPNQQYNLRMVFDLQNDEVDYYLDDVYKATPEFYDGDAEDARKFTISWTSTSNDFDIDNFVITKTTENPTGEEVEEEVEYTYNSDFLCAINWTTNSTSRSSQANCEARGFDTGVWYGFCVPRACIQDVGYLLVQWVTNNIFLTIIVILIIILIVPLVIAFTSKL